jgi:hypothetical protein
MNFDTKIIKIIYRVKKTIKIGIYIVWLFKFRGHQTYNWYTEHINWFIILMVYWVYSLHDAWVILNSIDISSTMPILIILVSKFIF